MWLLKLIDTNPIKIFNFRIFSRQQLFSSEQLLMNTCVNGTTAGFKVKFELAITEYRKLHKEILVKSLGYKKALEDAIENKKKYSHIKVSYESIVREYCEIGKQIEALEDVHNKLFS